MAASFNVGSFNAIDTSETKKSKSSKSSKSGGSNNELRKKLILFGGIILGIVVVIALVLFLLSVFMTPTYTYDYIENIMVNAAEAYFEDNPKRLPQSESQRVEIDVATLAASEYMDPMTEYMGEDTSCDGQVTVQTNGDGYMYVPRLDCGDDYVTQSLSEVVTSDIVTEGYGLYQVGDTYVYRGEEVNNYVQLETSLWRIVKITEDGNFMLILNGDMYESVPWDNRYNSDIGYNMGINTFSASRIRDTLEDLYDTDDEDRIILSDDDRSKLVSFDLCTGKRNTNDTTKDNSVECTEVLEDQMIGLLTATDYMMGSIDPNCTTVVDFSCQNYNYLAAPYKWWLVTAVNGVTDEAYGVSSSGVVENTTTASYMYPRPVVMLDSNVLFSEGKGTENKPYHIK